MDLCLCKHIGCKHAAFPELQNDTLPVFVQQRFRSILPRQRIFLQNLNIHRRFRKKLLFNSLFHLPDLLFLDQVPAENMYAKKITA